MKTAPAFDALDPESPENDLFGNEMTNCRHFTEYSAANTKVQGERAEKKIVKMLNPMEYVMDEMAQKAHHFRIRHGECDRDTSLVISAMLTAKLRERRAGGLIIIPHGIHRMRATTISTSYSHGSMESVDKRKERDGWLWKNGL